LRGGALVLAALPVVAGCSSVPDVPTWAGGLPANAPARPDVPAQYPAVHDVPPPRSDRPLTDEQQIKLEKDLAVARERVSPGSGKAAAASAKRSPQNSGTAPAQ